MDSVGHPLTMHELRQVTHEPTTTKKMHSGRHISTTIWLSIPCVAPADQIT
jgi:hypothetical protein